MSQNNLVYILDNKVYINLTNRCSNCCIFCLRQDKDDVCGQNMWLTDEQKISKDDVIEQFIPLIEKVNSNEVTFCGYGEPTLRFDLLVDVAKYIKQNYKDVKLKINTNGHANYIYKRNVVKDLIGLIDIISVSLNATNSEEYNKLSQPNFENAYEEVKKFIKSSSESGIETIATVVDGYKGMRLDIQKCEEISNSLGARLRVREWIEQGYS